MVAFAEKFWITTVKPSFINKNYTINCYMYCEENYIFYYNEIYLGP